jgi:hypothetical protein
MNAVCALRTCKNTMLMRSVPQSRVGIRMGQLWYCGVDCFASAALSRLAVLADDHVVEMPHQPRLTIGLVMLSKGYLTDQQLRFATAQSRLNGEELEVSLLRLGLANERQLAAARAAQWGCPVLGQERIGQPVELDIPATLLRISSAVPLHYSAATRRLLMGFVYRVEHSLLHAVEQVTDCKTNPCFITPTEFGAQMERLAVSPDHEEVVPAEPMTPAQMANTLGSLAIEVAAREATLINCRGYIWTRLSGKRRRVDVLFPARQAIEAGIRKNLSLQEEHIASWG